MESDKALFVPEQDILAHASQVETPFYLYDKVTIRKTCQKFKAAFSWAAPSFKNYFAVKATPNSTILKILKDEGFGVDCSSYAELELAKAMGFSGEDIFFTSNNTPIREFEKAKELGAIINLDDISHIDFIEETIGLPNLLCFRYNPGRSRSGNSIIGNPEESKFGMTRSQIFQALEKSRRAGVKKFGLHTMVLSNSLKEMEILENVKMMFELVAEIYTLTGVNLELVNFGGGIGIPYHPQDKEFDIHFLGQQMQHMYDELIRNVGIQPLRLVFECGRYITGPGGILVTRIIHQKNTYKKFIGVDACMANLMRPALYSAYHHITVLKEPNPEKLKNKLPSNRNLFKGNCVGTPGTFDIVGSLCENNDKLAQDRYLGSNVEIGDLLVIHDTGAHGHSMGFNYNGKLRSSEYLRNEAGEILCIRRKEELCDYFSTLEKIDWNN